MGNKFKGTPGPWRWDDNNFCIKAIDDSNPSYQTTIAHVNSKFDYSPGKKTQAHNSVLISYAPEMLDALIKISEFIEAHENINYKIRLLAREVPDIKELINTDLRRFSRGLF